jgi:hypothetical protein
MHRPARWLPISCATEAMGGRRSIAALIAAFWIAAF